MVAVGLVKVQTDVAAAWEEDKKQAIGPDQEDLESHVKRLIPDYDNFAEVHAKRSLNVNETAEDPLADEGRAD